MLRQGLKIIAITAVACYAGMWLAIFRADTYGVTARMLLAEFVIGSVFGMIFVMIGLYTRLRASKALLLAVVVMVLLVVAVEAWFGTEELMFEREVSTKGLSEYSRPRWYPFRSHGLTFCNGRSDAHD